MRTSMLRLTAVFISSAIASVSSAIDGDEPPAPNEPAYALNFDLFHAMEAVCGWGKTERMTGPNNSDDNITCSGVLVAPNIVLAAQHCFDSFSTFYDMDFDPSDSEMWLDPQTPRYMVRFRLKEDGTVGSLAGTHQSFYQVPVKRIIFPAGVSNGVGGTIPEMDMVLLVLADGPNDTDNGGLWADGWITHIDPAPVAPISYDSSAPFVGYPATFGPIPDPAFPFGRDRGILRYREVDPVWFRAPIDDAGNELAGFFDWFEVGDSGGVTFMQTETGEYIVCWGVPSGGSMVLGGGLFGSATWDTFFDQAATYGIPELYTPSGFDITGDPVPASGLYDEPDWSIDINDVIAMAALDLSHPDADWNDDGAVNINDYKLYANQLFVADNPYGATGMFPLLPASGDVNGDKRLNDTDSSALSGMLGSTDPADLAHDFDGSGTIDSADITILDRVLNTVLTAGGPEIFNNDSFGDLDNDGSLDCTDHDLIAQIGISFDGSVTGSSMDYDVRLDRDLNKVLDHDDVKYLSAQLLPGDVTTAYSSVYTPGNFIDFEAEPNFVLGTYDTRVFMYYHAENLRGFSYSLYPVGVDVVGDSWVPGGAYIQPDGQFSMTDVLYALHAWTDSCSSIINTDSLLDLWMLDLNGDGRVNILDMRILEPYIGSTLFEYDFNNDDGVFDAEDLDMFTKIVFAGSAFGQGFLGDYNGDGSPACHCGDPRGVAAANCQDVVTNACGDPVVSLMADCTDLSEMQTAGISALFGSGYVFGDTEFVVQLDADLDGDMDGDDMRAVLKLLQPGDITYDGEVDMLDLNEFLPRFALANGTSVGDPGFDADLDINSDDSIDFFDASALTGWIAAPSCP